MTAWTIAVIGLGALAVVGVVAYIQAGAKARAAVSGALRRSWRIILAVGGAVLAVVTVGALRRRGREAAAADRRADILGETIRAGVDREEAKRRIRAAVEADLADIEADRRRALDEVPPPLPPDATDEEIAAEWNRRRGRQ